MKIPCEKCLILAICKQRDTIKCDLLNSLACNVLNGDKNIADWWKLIHSSLPLAERIRSSKGS